MHNINKSEIHYAKERHEKWHTKCHIIWHLEKVKLLKWSGCPGLKGQGGGVTIRE